MPVNSSYMCDRRCCCKFGDSDFSRMVSTSPFREQVLRKISYMTLDSTCLQSEVDVLAYFLSLSSFLVLVVLDLVLHGLFPSIFCYGVDRSSFAFFQKGGQEGWGSFLRGEELHVTCLRAGQTSKVLGFFHCMYASHDS
jgi:hypothetical protein